MSGGAAALEAGGCEGIPVGVERLVPWSPPHLEASAQVLPSGRVKRNPYRNPFPELLRILEVVVGRDTVEETIVASPPRPRARSRGRATEAGLAARSGSPNGLQPVLAERGEVDHQVDGVCQTRR